MKRNKFLDEIGLKEYGADYGLKKDKRRKKWKKQRMKYGFDERETWNLKDTYIEWLYSRLMMFRKKASKVIAPASHTFMYKGKKYSLDSAVKFIIKKCRLYLKARDMSEKDITPEEQEKINSGIKEALHLWAEIFPYMCW